MNPLFASLCLIGGGLNPPDTTWLRSGKIWTVTSYSYDSLNQTAIKSIRDFDYEQRHTYSGFFDSSGTFISDGPFCIVQWLQGNDTVISGFYKANFKNGPEKYFKLGTRGSQVISFMEWRMGIRVNTWINYYPSGKVYQTMQWLENDSF